jgi:tetratricopeptide (TPR) repeat protein
MAALLAIGVTGQAHADARADCLQAGNAELSVKGCSEVIASGKWSGPNLVWAYVNRGDGYHQLRQYDRAIADYDEALLLKPGDADALFNRARAYYQLGQYGRALQDYDQSLVQAPGKPDALSERGLTLRALGRSREAIGDFDEALEIDPTYYKAYSWRGDARYDLGQPDLAFEDWAKAIRLEGGKGVERWQRWLKDKGLYQGGVTGLFDAATEMALRACARTADCLR